MKILTTIAIVALSLISASVVSAEWEVTTPSVVQGYTLTVPYNVRVWSEATLYVRAEPFNANIYGQGTSSPSVTVSTPTVALSTGYNTGEVTFTFLRSGKYELTMEARYPKSNRRESQVNPEPLVVEVKAARWAGVSMTLSKIPQTFSYAPYWAVSGYATAEPLINPTGLDFVEVYVYAYSSYRPLRGITIDLYYYSPNYGTVHRTLRPRFPRQEGGYISEFTFKTAAPVDLTEYSVDGTITVVDMDGGTETLNFQSAP